MGDSVVVFDIVIKIEKHIVVSGGGEVFGNKDFLDMSSGMMGIVNASLTHNIHSRLSGAIINFSALSALSPPYNLHFVLCNGEPKQSRNGPRRRTGLRTGSFPSLTPSSSSGRVDLLILLIIRKGVERGLIFPNWIRISETMGK